MIQLAGFGLIFLGIYLENWYVVAAGWCVCDVASDFHRGLTK